MSDVLADLAAADTATIVDTLYALDPASFTQARNAVAKALRAAKRRSDAAEVARLPRPTAAAAALNRVARSRPDLMVALRRAGGLLRDVQGAVVRGDVDAAVLKQASDERRAAVRTVMAALAGAGADDRRDELVRTLEAASVDDELGEALVSGRLARTVVGGVGFEGLLGATEPAPPRLRLVGPDERAAPRSDQDRIAEHQRDEQQRAEQQRAEQQRAEQQRAEAERARAVRIASAEATAAEALERHRRAVERSAAADGGLRAAQATALAAEQAWRAARSALDVAEAELAVAEELATSAAHDVGTAEQSAREARAALAAALGDTVPPTTSGPPPSPPAPADRTP